MLSLQQNLLRGSNRNMDPLSVLGTAKTILIQVNRIREFVDAAKTNTKKLQGPLEEGAKVETDCKET